MSHFFLSYPFLLPVVTWVIAQGLKISLRLLDRKFDRNYLFSSGGMPSVHAVFVTSLTTLVAWIDGVHSLLFAVSFVLSLIVLYDAMHVRQEAGKHATILNTLLSDQEHYDPLNPYIGHTFFEVLVGSMLGILLTCLLLAF
jgi:hypothetical protein